MRRLRQTATRARALARAFFEWVPWLASAALACAVAYGSAGGDRRLSVDDLLKLSQVGRAITRPGTGTFVWEQSPPYDRLADYGAGVTGTWQGSDYEIFTADSGSTSPTPLFKATPGTTFRLGDFSKDGRFLTLLSMHEGKVRLAVFDFSRRRLTEFPVAPNFPATQATPDWAWLDKSHLVVAAYPAGAAGPWELTFRRAIGVHLEQSWARSWAGKQAAVDRYESPDSDAGRPLPGRLIIVDVRSGHIQQLATGMFTALRPSPDGRWLVAVLQSSLPQTEHPHLDWTYARSSLRLFSLIRSSDAKEAAPGLDVLPDSLEWSPSSSALVFFAWPVESQLRSGEFHTLDPRGPIVSVIPHTGLALASQRERAGPQWPERVIWEGDSIAVYARPTPDQAGSFTYEDIKTAGVIDARVALASKPAHWFLLRDAAPIDLTPGMQNVSPIPVIASDSRVVVVGDGRIWRLDASGAPTSLFPDAPPLLDSLAYRDFFRQPQANDSRRFFSVIGDPDKLARVGLEHGEPVFEQFLAPTDTSILAISDSGTVLGQIGAGKNARLALIDPGRTPRTIGAINPILNHVAETRWIDFPYKNRVSSARPNLSGCLLLPPDYQSNRRYPLIVEIYPDRPGGCGSPERRYLFAMGALRSPYTEHVLAAKDFVVLRPDTGGGISRTTDGPQAAMSDVVDAGIDAAVAAGYADPGRVGLIGFSQGGFAALWLATQSQRYKAVVSLNGWADLATSFFEMISLQEFAPEENPARGGYERYLTGAGSPFSMGDTPWRIPERYLANSPLWRSDKVAAPILLIHSDMDVFDDAEYKAFFSSLSFQKKRAKLLIYRGEGHSPSSPANIKDMWTNIIDWFDRYLDVKRDQFGLMLPQDP
jgi:dienelactone hydrolase